MLKTFTVLSAVSMISLSVLAETPVYAARGKVCFRDDAGVRQCLTKREAKQLLRE